MQHKECNCYRCTYGEEAYKLRVKDSIAIHGFMVQSFTHDCNCPNHTNIHTHGLAETFNHPDIQLCYPLSPDKFMALFNWIVKDIKAGQRFEVGRKYMGIVIDYPVEFINAIEDDRHVLRLLVCDKNGEYPPGPFGDQLTMTGYENVN